jgi:hypothetical protein
MAGLTDMRDAGGKTRDVVYSVERWRGLAYAEGMASGGAATKLEGRFASDENAEIWSGKFKSPTTTKP